MGKDDLFIRFLSRYSPFRTIEIIHLMRNKMPGGRPKKLIDYKTVKALAGVMATMEEIASALEISVRTLQRDEEFCRVYKIGLDNAKLSLRRNQFKMSVRNPTMAIWLGKQYLGQTEVGYYAYQVPIIPKTVGQFTGLPSQDKQDIYEGDRLFDYDDDYYVVEFSEGRFVAVGDGFEVDLFEIADRCSIIGNIHDNKEIK